MSRLKKSPGPLGFTSGADAAEAVQGPRSELVRVVCSRHRGIRPEVASVELTNRGLLFTYLMRVRPAAAIGSNYAPHAQLVGRADLEVDHDLESWCPECGASVAFTTGDLREGIRIGKRPTYIVARTQ